MKSFSKRNPIPIGLASLAVIAVLLVLAYRTDSLPVIGSGPEYKAQFSEAAGLAAGDEVRIAGVKVGKVTKIALDQGHVLVTFRAKDADLGDATTASIQIKTLLGDKFLAVDPAGSQPLTSDDQIPLERTVAPYDVVVAFNQLSENVGQLDTTQLATSLRTLSETFKDTPKDVKTSLDGLSRLSVTIASRNDQLAHLLDNTDKATGLLSARNQDITAILGDGSKLLEELNHRQDAIRKLLDGTRELSKELRGLIDDNEDQIGHTLDELDRLTDMLQKHEDDIVKGVRRLGPFATVFTNALGSGHWFDNTVFGLLPEGLLPPTGIGTTNKVGKVEPLPPDVVAKLPQPLVSMLQGGGR
jgi:phospholipid/cholesterol/gamma-HCH transport system substrate-binding protein